MVRGDVYKTTRGDGEIVYLRCVGLCSGKTRLVPVQQVTIRGAQDTSETHMYIRPKAINWALDLADSEIAPFLARSEKIQ